MTAYRILYEVYANGAYPNIEIKKHLLSDISDADKRLLVNIVYGCVQNSIYLDYIISRFSSVKLKKISQNVLLILRMGIYQIFMLDRVPDSAAVDECVKIAGKAAYKSKGFVNAVLRNAARNKNNVSLPQSKEEYASVRYSFPPELCSELSECFGEDAEDIMKALSMPPPISARVNTLKCDKEALTALLENKSVYLKDGMLSNSVILKGSDIASLSEYSDGLFTCQGEASMIAVRALGVKEGMTVIDACAAPGGKSTYIAEIMKNKGKIYSFDIYDHKAELIKKNAKRLGIDIIEARVKDSSVFDKEFENAADAVLVDAPCSGIGIAAKKPDIKFSYSKEKSEELSKLQLKILTANSKYVKKGGTLVYSTCTLLPRENEEVCRKFLENNKDFEACAPDYLPPCIKRESPFVTLLPGKDNTDGFFICKMKKK